MAGDRPNAHRPQARGKRSHVRPTGISLPKNSAQATLSQKPQVADHTSQSQSKPPSPKRTRHQIPNLAGKMEATPLASLSLTHVHYVSPPFLPLPTSPPLKHNPESRRSNILLLRLARPRTSSALRSLRDAAMGDAGGGNTIHVCRTNGMRSSKFRSEAVDKRRKT